jgi:hypothetical protein
MRRREREVGMVPLCFVFLSLGMYQTPGQQQDNQSQHKENTSSGLKIGKFEVLAVYTYARALRDGLSEPEAKERGIVAAVMGARARGASRGGGGEPTTPTTAKQEPGIKRKPLTAETYDRQVAAKLQPFYDSVFLPTIKKLVAARLTYQQVKDLLELPPAVGAKITAVQFSERTSAYLKRAGERQKKPAIPSEERRDHNDAGRVSP